MLSWLVGDKIWDTIITIAIIAAVVLILITLIKYKHARPYVVALFCIAWLAGGVYSAFTMVDYYTKERNQVVGELQEYNPYEDFDFFEYKLTNLAFYPNEEGNYVYETTYATSMPFDGSSAEYTLLLNNSPCKETSSAFGRLKGETNLIFYNVDGEQTSNIELFIMLTFKSSEIELEIVTSATNENIGLLEEYVACNGFNLRIIERVYQGGA